MNSLLLNNERLFRKLCLLNNIRDQALKDNVDKVVITREDARDIIVKYWERAAPKHIVVGIGGFSASGKTTTAKFLVSSINAPRQSNLSAYLPMDGFHLSNRMLSAGGLENIKGDISTFDVAAYTHKVQEFKGSFGALVLAPDYIRDKHEVVENKIAIGPTVYILVTEGIYVGYSVGEWRVLSDLLDITFYLDAHPEQCADRVVARNLQVGRDEEEIERKLDNDFRFMETSVQILRNADYIIREDQ